MIFVPEPETIFSSGNNLAGIGNTLALGAEGTESGSMAAGGNPLRSVQLH